MKSVIKKVFSGIICFIMALITMVACVACQPTQSSSSPNTSESGNSGTGSNGDSNEGSNGDGVDESGDGGLVIEPIKIQAEESYQSVSGKWNKPKLTSDSKADGGYIVVAQKNGSAVNADDYLSFRLNVSVAGEYQLNFVSKDSAASMMVQFKVNDVNVGDVVDAYNSKEGYYPHEVGTVTLEQAGDFIIQIYYVGKNESNTNGYPSVKFDYFTLTKI